MNDILLTILASVLGAVPACVISIWSMNRYFKQKENEMKQWIGERQQLLDRIQAPSFDHLKSAEVRVIRAQKDEKKEQPYELL